MIDDSFWTLQKIEIAVLERLAHQDCDKYLSSVAEAAGAMNWQEHFSDNTYDFLEAECKLA